MPGDYEGDGKTDPSDCYKSTGFGIPVLIRGNAYGADMGRGFTDIPVPGDYDGVGKTEIGINRPVGAVPYLHGKETGSTLPFSRFLNILNFQGNLPCQRGNLPDGIHPPPHKHK